MRHLFPLLLTVTDFGAIPNDGKSDRDAVVAALAAAHQQDGPAVVYFPKGNYRLFEAEDFGKPRLVVKRSNIVYQRQRSRNKSTRIQ